jgi:RNA 3'-terminal phosphate cyclase-like protein
LRLLEKITNGTTIEISYTGTTVLVHPGLLPGGSYTHTCPLTRPIGYFLETLLVLGPFGKRPLDVRLEGITGEEGKDMSVDMLRTVGLPTLHVFGVIEGLVLHIKRRGAAPLGGGLVIFKCPVVKNVKTLDFVDPGRIKRIRGIALVS